MENLSTQDKNRIIVENLFGLKVIFPQDYYRNLKGKDADQYRTIADHCTNNPVIVKNNKPLKTHSIDSRPLPDFYAPLSAPGLLAEARKILFSRGLHLAYARTLQAVLAEHTPATDDEAQQFWNLLDAPGEWQADAIVTVLLDCRK